MALVPHKITALAENDSEGGGNNVISGAVVSLYDNEGSAVTLFDNESGANGSTAKTTDSTGQVVVWVTPGEYDEAVNGSTLRKVTVGGNNRTDVSTLSELQLYRPHKTGQSFFCQENGLSYVLQPSGYMPMDGDVAFQNGRIGRNISGSVSVDRTYNIPTDFPTLQEAVDFVVNNIENKPQSIVVLNIESGHSPSSGIVLNNADAGHVFIRSDDPTVTVESGSYLADTFIQGYYSTFPTIDTLFDCSSVGIGLNLGNICSVRITPGNGFINANVYNFQMRSSRADVEGAIFDGAGQVGCRVEQASQIKAQTAEAKNCGVIGFDVSRGSTANLMFTKAPGCGFDAESVLGDANANNQGGIVVRRSLVAADGFDGSGSTRGISIQLNAKVNCPDSNLSGCTLSGARVSGGATLNMGSCDVTNCDTGVVVGYGAKVIANDCDFTGCSTPWALFASSGQLDVTDSVYSSPGDGPEINSPSPSGTVWNNSKPNVHQLDGSYTYNLTMNPDTATSFTIPGAGGGRAFMAIVSSTGTNLNGIAWCRMTNTASSVIAGGANFAVSTGVLNGTTGASGALTISPHSDGELYVEFRGGAQTEVSILIVSQTNF